MTSSPNSTRIAVILVAAGRGRRLGAPTPKQYIPLNGTPALHRAALAFLRAPGVTDVITVIHPDDTKLYETAMSGLDDPRLHPPVPGGETRAASVHEGLKAVAKNAPDLVLIHDAARPFVSQQVIAAVITGLGDTDGACAALQVVDAIWAAPDGMADTPLDRSMLWRAQTPQGFRFAPILAAHAAHDGSGADDVAVAREAGLAVRFVPGDEANYKITTAADLERALADAASQDNR